ncbi:MAG: SDR family NAD(P)-dependent oxidoreductase [Candidatus Helarchaeales archaeon]
MSSEMKNIIITGAGSGFGRAMAIRLASEGNNLILNDINEETLNETKKLLEKFDVQVQLHVGDTADSSFLKSMVDSTIKEFQDIHVLINNAGIGGEVMNFIDLPEKELERVLDVNFKAYWKLSKLVAKKMKTQRKLKPLRGKIINISSIAGKLPMEMLGAYSCSKAAVNAMTIVLAKELAPRITVNAVCPGFHVTGIYKNDPNLVQEYMKIVNAKITLKRLGTAEDIANIISFLVSEDSNYMTGQLINYDGGVIFY